MDTNKREGFAWDIAIAGVLGGIIGLALAVALDWSPWLWTPICAALGFLSYKPVVLWQTIQSGLAAGWNDLRISWDDRRLGRKYWKKGAKILGYVVGGLSSYIILVLATTLYFDWDIGRNALLTAWATTMTGIWMLVVTNNLLWTFTAGRNKKARFFDQEWAYPLLSRALKSGYIVIYGLRNPDSQYGNRTDIPSKINTWNVVELMLIGPLLCTCTLFLIAWLFDIIVNCIFAVASTRRLAAMIGGAMFGATATVVHLTCETAHPLLWFTIASGVGFLAGPAFYHLRMYFEEHPVVIEIPRLKEAPQTA